MWTFDLVQACFSSMPYSENEYNHFSNIPWITNLSWSVQILRVKFPGYRTAHARYVKPAHGRRANINELRRVI